MGFAQDWRETPSLCRGQLLLGARSFVRCPHGNTSSFPRRIFCARALHLCFAHPNEGWAERRETFGCDAPAVRAMTRHARRLRGAMRPLRDARLSALRHRGDFGLRGRACLTGICAGSVTASSSHPGRSAWRAGSLPPGANGYEPPPQDATPRSAFRIVSRTRPTERGCESI